jgi:FtsZ-interacting cell division protein ZipA
MLETITSISLLTIIVIVGPIVLLAAMVYGTMAWHRRDRAATAARDEATRRLYSQKDDAEAPRL